MQKSSFIHYFLKNHFYKRYWENTAEGLAKKRFSNEIEIKEDSSSQRKVKRFQADCISYDYVIKN